MSFSLIEWLSPSTMASISDILSSCFILLVRFKLKKNYKVYWAFHFFVSFHSEFSLTFLPLSGIQFSYLSLSSIFHLVTCYCFCGLQLFCYCPVYAHPSVYFIIIFFELIKHVCYIFDLIYIALFSRQCYELVVWEEVILFWFNFLFL